MPHAEIAHLSRPLGSLGGGISTDGLYDEEIGGRHHQGIPPHPFSQWDPSLHHSTIWTSRGTRVSHHAANHDQSV